MALKFLNDGYFAGKVGIGTESPAVSLEVAGSIRIDNGASFTSYQVYRDNIKYGDVGGGGNQFTIQASNNKNINLFDDNGTGLTVKDGGNVGIGTTSPTRKLHVNGDVQVDTNLVVNSGIYNTTYYAGSSTATYFKNSVASDTLTILESGNVGIGISTPTSKLHINQNVTDPDLDFPSSFAVEIDSNHSGSAATTGDREQGGLYIDVDSSTTGGDTSNEHRLYGIYNTVNHSGDSDLVYATYSLAEQNTTAGTTTNLYAVNATATSDGGANAAVTNAVGVYGVASMQDNTPVGSSYAGKFLNNSISNRAGSTSNTYGISAEIQIDSTSAHTNLYAGRFIIDSNAAYTSTNSYLLHLDYQGTSLATNTYAIYSLSDVKSYHEGDLGIGTATPDTKLEVVKDIDNSTNTGTDGNATQILHNGDVSGTAVLKLRGTGSNSGAIVFGGGVGASTDKFNIISRYNNTKILTAVANGNVGIGRSTSITAKLFVEGPADTSTISTSSTPAARINNGGAISNWIGSNGYNYGYIQSIQDDGSNNLKPLSLNPLGGNVGIGTTNPSTKLHIEGASTGYLQTIKNTTAGGDYLQMLAETGDAVFQFESGGTGGEATLNMYRDGTQYVKISADAGVNNYFNNGANVGIGTTAPLTKLHAEGVVTIKGSNDATGGSLAIQDNYSGTNHLGNIGWNRSAGGPYLAYGIKQDGSADWKSTFDNFSGMRSYMKLDNNEMQLAWAPAQQTTVDTVITGLLERFTFQLDTGTLKLNAYDSTNQTGTPTYLLGTDASGNVVKTLSTPGGDPGPYLPLAGGTMTGTNGVLMPDNFKLKFGDATTPDLEIFHNGSNSYVRDSGTGGLVLEGSTMLELKARSGELYLRGNENSSVQLYHNNNLKLNTANTGVAVTGDINIDSALLSNQENTDVDTGTETVANVAIATYTAAFFDFVIKKTTNVRSGTVYACHDGTNVEFTETSTQDLGDTSDVTLSVDISGGNMRLRATTTSDDWSIKSLIRAI
jgi:hypothetical protein